MGSAIAAAAGALMLAAAPASGALSYVVGPNTTTGPAAQGSATASCPASTFVVGGGAFSTGAFGAVATGSSGPSGNASWVEETDVHAGTQSHRAFAICDATMPNVEFGSKLVPTGEERRVRAECPSGENVYGGGYLASPNYGNTNTRSSRPYDDDDPDKDRDDGWEVTTFNFAPAPTEALVYAECGPRGSTARVSTRAISPNSQKAVRTACPAGDRVTGGGAYAAGGNGNNWISSISPEDGNSDQDALPDDRWEGYLENDTGKRREIKAYVVCR